MPYSDCGDISKVAPYAAQEDTAAGAEDHPDAQGDMLFCFKSFFKVRGETDVAHETICDACCHASTAQCIISMTDSSGYHQPCYVPPTLALHSHPCAEPQQAFAHSVQRRTPGCMCVGTVAAVHATNELTCCSMACVMLKIASTHVCACAIGFVDAVASDSSA